jgi:eukaryotic-like serine/threonine-protein kinase
VTETSCRTCGQPAPDATGLCESCKARAYKDTFVAPPPSESSTDPRLFDPDDLPSAVGFGPGQSFADRYTIVERIGDGGMGEVYKAIDRRRQGRTVALKLVRAGLAQHGDALLRFRRELDLAQKVSHANVCRLHDLGEVGGQLYISMEHVDGQTLDDLIRTMGHLSPQQTASLGRQICAGLGAVHDQGIVHRDLKPSNVMVDRAGHAIVMDFGMAYHPEAEKLTRAGMVVGTLAYVAPEQARGSGTDTRSDVYALGLLLYEMLTGRRPPGDGAPLPLALRDANDACPPPSHFAPEVHPALDAVVMRCLARDPAARFDSVREVAAELARVADSLATTLAPLLASRFAAGTLVSRSRSRRLRILSALLVVVLVGAWLYQMARPPAGPPVSIALLPLSYTGPPEHSNLAELVPLFLSDALRARKGSQVSPFSSSRTFSPKEEAASVGRQLNVSFVVQGEVSVSGQETRTLLRLRGTSAAEGPSRDFASPTDDPLAVAEAMADWITATAGLGAPTVTPATANRRKAMEPYLRGRTYLEGWDVERNYARAEEAFRRAMELDPSFAEAHAGLALALVNDYQETLTPDRVPQAAAAAEQAVRLAPDLPEPRLALGVVELARGQSAEAAATLQKAADLATANDAVARLIGQAYADNGRKAEAERFLRRAIALRPDYWENHNALGRFLASQGRYEEAKAPFREVIRLRPQSDTGYTNLAGMHLYRGERDLAEPLLKESLRLQPTAQAHNFLGMVQYATGRFAEAAEQFEEASRSGSEHLAYKGNLGDAHRQLGRRKEADAAYADAILTGRRQLEVNPKDSETRAGLGMFLAGSRRCAEARPELAQALRAGPENPTVHYYAAISFAICGDQPQATEEAVRAIQGGMIDVSVNPDLKAILNEPRVRKALSAAAGP